MNSSGMSHIRKNNTRNRILNIIRVRGKVSKIEIKNISKYSMGTVLGVVDELISSNLVHFTEKGNTASGRRPTYISINPEGGYFVGVTFNAASVGVSILNYCGEMIDFSSVSLNKSKLSPDYVLGQVFSILDEILSGNSNVLDKTIGMGIGVPGQISSSEAGVASFYPHIPDWKNIHIKKQFELRYPSMAVYMENNVNALALAYKWLVPDFSGCSYIIIWIRSGVRMSYVINGALYKGKSSVAGEIGHLRVMNGSRYCPCGKRGCLESEISENGVRNIILEGIRANRFQKIMELANNDENNIDMGLFNKAVMLGDSDCLSLLNDVCDYLGEAITQLASILDFSKVIIAARLCELEDVFFGKLSEIVNERIPSAAVGTFSIEATEFGPEFSAVGSAAIVMEHELGFVEAAI